MALEDRDIFLAVCNRFGDQPIEFIMEQYEKAKKINIEIEKRLDVTLHEDAVANVTAPEVKEDAAVKEEPAPQKRYNKRMLKVKPQDAITENAIYCCICGEERQSLTTKHLAGHGISVANYKKLCGYTPDQPLMSRKRLSKSKEIIARAQKARLDKKAAMSEY